MATKDVIIDMSNSQLSNTSQYNTQQYNTQQYNIPPEYNTNIDYNGLVDIDTKSNILISVCKYVKKYFPNSKKNYDDLSA